MSLRDDDLEFAGELWWFMKGVGAMLFSVVAIGAFVYFVTTGAQ